MIDNKKNEDNLISVIDESNVVQCCKNKYCKEFYEIALAAQRTSETEVSFYFNHLYQDKISICTNVARRELLLPCDFKNTLLIPNCFIEQPNKILEIILDRIEKGNYRDLSVNSGLRYFRSYERALKIIHIFNLYKTALLSLNAYEKIQKPLMTFSPK